MAVSMYESSVDVFSQYLGNLSGIRDRAAAHARRTPDRSRDFAAFFTFRNGSTRKFTGKSLLLTFSVPQFFFHITTAYDILHHNGVDLAKKNFLGSPKQA